MKELPQSVHASWAKIIEYLEGMRLRIQAEITNYPMPIPACDAHFNHLLEERARICEELRQAHIAAAAANHGDSQESLKIYFKSSRYIDDAVMREIAARS